MNVPIGSARSLFISDVSVSPSGARLSVIGLLRKHFLTIAASFILVTILVSLVLFWLPSTYVSTAKVLVQLDDMPNPAFFSGITPSRERVTDEPANRQMENEMELAEVWPVSAAAVRQLDLKYDNVYEAPLTKLMRPAGELWDWFAANILKLHRDPDRHGFADTVALFAKSYTVGTVTSKSADTNSNIISFTLQGTSPERSQQSLQAVLDAYIAEANALRKNAAENARKVVFGSAEDARTRVDEAQKRLDEFLSGRANQGDANPAQSHAEAVELDRMLRLRQQELIDVEHRLSQIEMYLDLNANDIDHRVVVEPPVRPRSSEWKKKAIVGVAAAISGLLLGIFLAGLRELFDHRLSNAAAVKAYLDLPVIATIPNLKAKQRADLVRRPRALSEDTPFST